MKIEELKDALSIVKDLRRTNLGNIRHKLEDIIIIVLCAPIGNGGDFEDMENFGKEGEEWLKKFLELPNGIPDVETSMERSSCRFNDAIFHSVSARTQYLYPQLEI